MELLWACSLVELAKEAREPRAMVEGSFALCDERGAAQK